MDIDTSGVRTCARGWEWPGSGQLGKKETYVILKKEFKKTHQKTGETKQNKKTPKEQMAELCKTGPDASAF